MQRQIIVMFLSLFCLALNPAWADAGQGQGQPRGALFKVQAKGSANTLYLFGTMHVGLPEFYPLEPRIGALVAKASVLALEIDAAANPAGMAADMARFGMLAPGARGYADLPAPQRLRLDQLLAKRQIPMAAVAPLKPWLLATVLVVSEFTAIGYRADLAVDSHLAQLARQNKVKVIELESAGAQLALFNRLPEDAQWRFLEESMDGIENGKQRAQVRQIVDAWRLADQAGLDAIARMAAEDDSVSGKFMQQVLLDERNVQLADKMAKLVDNEPNAVAAVGVLHLVGARAIPQLLKERGLTVERVY
jgi:uncharacterized protein YbaP (TraB family)